MKRTEQTTNGTSFHGHTIRLSLNELLGFCGFEPHSYMGTDDKVQYEWEMETDDGDVFTIYDWKEYRIFQDHEVIEWHIGSHTPEICEEALHELQRYKQQLLN